MSSHDPTSGDDEDFYFEDNEFSIDNMYNDDGVMHDVSATERETYEEEMTMETSNAAEAGDANQGTTHERNTLNGMTESEYLKESHDDKNRRPSVDDFEEGSVGDDRNANGADDSSDPPPPPIEYDVSIQDMTHLADKFRQTMKSWSDKLLEAMTTHDKATAEFHAEYARIQRLEHEEAERLQKLEPNVHSATYGLPSMSMMHSEGAWVTRFNHDVVGTNGRSCLFVTFELLKHDRASVGSCSLSDGRK